MTLFFFLAQSQSALAGAEGWTGAGLLGLVLGWLMFKHLPAKDAQLEKLIATHSADMKQARDEFKAALQIVIDHCKDEMSELTGKVVRRDKTTDIKKKPDQE